MKSMLILVKGDVEEKVRESESKRGGWGIRLSERQRENKEIRKGERKTGKTHKKERKSEGKRKKNIIKEKNEKTKIDRSSKWI